MTNDPSQCVVGGFIIITVTLLLRTETTTTNTNNYYYDYVLAKRIPRKVYQTNMSKSREHQSLNKVFRAGLHLDAGAY